jgi:hypothetical protein
LAADAFDDLRDKGSVRSAEGIGVSDLGGAGFASAVMVEGD